MSNQASNQATIKVGTQVPNKLANKVSIKQVSSAKAFDGLHQQYTHDSTSTNCNMHFAIYLPPGASTEHPVPVLYWLSGLTCTDENFMQKAGALKYAAQCGMAIVAPDTSPRGDAVADDPAYDFGQGAGFYVNATQAPYKQHYQMYDYVVDELPALIEANFPVSSTKSISGHSMGGHGALMIALRNPHAYVCASAFSPIVNPLQCPWGQKAFNGYLGTNDIQDSAGWAQYDTCALMQQAQPEQYIPMLVSQGEDDSFLDEQLLTANLAAVAAHKEYPIKIEWLSGYDHSYYFISSFIEHHIGFHWQKMHQGKLSKNCD
ncbi:MAG: S-formylglutathione hydrolase [Glaciecola sp.]|nr:S-formylglutathione hydrolase [Glaciecola sp.]MDG1815304.1 S-formylglutathione hydrolase [Glaciecola sp.]MDG2099232.1 S-formylglutathione hydrolase [Glaciecola sp.]